MRYYCCSRSREAAAARRRGPRQRRHRVVACADDHRERRRRRQHHRRREHLRAQRRPVATRATAVGAGVPRARSCVCVQNAHVRTCTHDRHTTAQSKCAPRRTYVNPSSRTCHPVGGGMGDSEARGNVAGARVGDAEASASRSQSHSRPSVDAVTMPTYVDERTANGVAYTAADTRSATCCGGPSVTLSSVRMCTAPSCAPTATVVVTAASSSTTAHGDEKTGPPTRTVQRWCAHVPRQTVRAHVARRYGQSTTTIAAPTSLPAAQAAPNERDVPARPCRDHTRARCPPHCRRPPARGRRLPPAAPAPATKTAAPAASSAIAPASRRWRCWAVPRACPPASLRTRSCAEKDDRRDATASCAVSRTARAAAERSACGRCTHRRRRSRAGDAKTTLSAAHVAPTTPSSALMASTLRACEPTQTRPVTLSNTAVDLIWSPAVGRAPPPPPHTHTETGTDTSTSRMPAVNAHIRTAERCRGLDRPGPAQRGRERASVL